MTDEHLHSREPDANAAPALVDAAARDRLVRELRTSPFVEAGAGSGKTTVLTERICESIRVGVARIDEIVAITFTNASAAEMRERIRLRMNCFLHETQSSDEKSRFSHAIANINVAPIQTIHAFAERLLRMHGVNLGISPQFELIDTAHLERQLARNWREMLDGFDDLPHAEITLAYANLVGFDVRKTAKFLKFLVSQRAVLMATPRGSALRLPTVDRSELVQACDIAQELLVHCDSCTDPDDKLRVKLLSLKPWVATTRALLESQAEDYELFAHLFANRPPSVKSTLQKSGKKSTWKVDIEQVRAMFAEFGKIYEAECEKVARYLYAHSSDRLIACAQSTITDNRRNGLLDFDDLIVLCRDVLRIDAVRHSVRSRFLLFFIDEFQDTDPLQCEIASLLTSSSQKSPDDPKLFVVGDPKQAIYRFRGADIDQYRSVRDDWKSPRMELSTNFRTQSNILSWINATFANVFFDTDVPWSELSPGRACVDGSVQVRGCADVDSSSVADVRAREAADIGSVIQQAVSKGWSVQTESGSRRARYGDIALLLPRRSSLQAFETVLNELAIPYRIESRSMIWHTDEVNNLIVLLRTIANTYDDLALIAALRSPLFGVSDVELVEWRSQGGSWHIFATQPAGLAGSRIATAFAYLRSLAHQRFWKSPSSLLETIVNDRRVDLMPFAFARQREWWNRTRFLIEQARAWQVRYGESLQAFLSWVDVKRQQKHADIESPLAEPDDDAVRIMTIHTAKGLEFPITVVGGVGTLRSPQAESSYVYEREFILKLQDGLSHPSLEKVSSFQKKLELEEQLRLLYVACTRARDHLVVSVWRPIDKAQAAVTRLANACESVVEYPPRSIHGEFQLDQVDLVTHNTSVMSPDMMIDGLTEQQARRESCILQGKRPISVSATTLARVQADRRWASRLVRFGQELDEWSYDVSEKSDIRAYREFGLAVHQALEFTAPNADSARVEKTARLAAKAFGIEAHFESVVASVTMALESPVMKSAIVAPNIFHELPVFASFDNTVIEGVIDFAFESPEGFVVVDYKTEYVDDANIDEASARYMPQLVTYAAALGASAKLPIDRLTLLFISPRMAAARAVDVPFANTVRETKNLLRETIPMIQRV